MAGKRKFILSEEIGRQLQRLAVFGHTNAEMARVMGVSESTLEKRLREQDQESGEGESILTALKKAREVADAEVVHSLYTRATGFFMGTRYFPPDVTAAIFWLKNRQPDKWRDVQKTESTVEVTKAPPGLTIIIEGEPEKTHQK